MSLPRNVAVAASAVMFFACLGRVSSSDLPDAGVDSGSSTGSSKAGTRSSKAGTASSGSPTPSSGSPAPSSGSPAPSSGSPTSSEATTGPSDATTASSEATTASSEATTGSSGGASGSGSGARGSSSIGSGSGSGCLSYGTCSSTESMFNGCCRADCTTSVTCARGTRCMEVAPGESLCLPYQSCSYLSSDTQCAAIYSGGRFQLESDPPDASPLDVTPYLDPYFSPASGTQSTDPGGGGCEGDATYVQVPATGDVACGQTHHVVRCRQAGYQCLLVPGTTTDFVSP